MATSGLLAAPSSSLVAGQFEIDHGKPLPEAGGGLPAFAARDVRSGAGGLIAVQVHRQRPARARALTALGTAPLSGVLTPLAHGVARPQGRAEAGLYVIAPAPPGPSLAASPRAWPEAELLHHVLRPAAAALAALQARGVTHRAIRPENLFHAGPGTKITLGLAWAAPPASLQPALFEPPYSAMCPPCARGEGRIADDVYALGVTLLVLALGRAPLQGLDDHAIIARKIADGSYRTLVGNVRLPPALRDLLVSMLAEDPEHRPAPSLLANPAAARTRTIAARPLRQAQWPLELGGVTAWSIRSLAYGVARDAEGALRLVRSGGLDVWLRRALGDAALAARIDDLARPLLKSGPTGRHEAAGETLLLVRLVAALDPFAPVCWGHGLALWPDGLGAALAALDGSGDRLKALIAAEAIVAWALERPERCDVNDLRAEARHHRMALGIKGPASGIDRLRYALNPLLPCRSSRLQQHWALQPGDLLLALESVTGASATGALPFDPEMFALLAARSDGRAVPGGGGIDLMSQIQTIAHVQERLNLGPLPALAGSLIAPAGALLERVRSRSRRAALKERLETAAKTGIIRLLLGALDDPGEKERDKTETQMAAAALARLDGRLARLARDEAAQDGMARCLGQELATGVGLAAFAAALLLAAIG